MPNIDTIIQYKPGVGGGLMWAAKSGFELINIGTERMDAFMKNQTEIYTEGAKRLGLGLGKRLVTLLSRTA